MEHQTLILNGTYHSNTNPIINMLTDNLTGEYKIVNLYTLEISQIISSDIENFIKSCNAIILISPIIFGTLSGRLVDFASHFIDTSLSIAPKNGSVIFINNNEDTSCASETAKRIMDSFNVQERFPDVIVDDGKYDNILSMVNWINSKSSHIVSDKIVQTAKVTKLSSPQDKINLFRSLFKGREDVYALRWYNVKTEKAATLLFAQINGCPESAICQKLNVPTVIIAAILPSMIQLSILTLAAKTHYAVM